MRDFRTASYPLQQPANSKIAVLVARCRRPANECRRDVAVWALSVMLALAAVTSNADAATLVWTNGDGVWQSTTAWSPAGGFPGAGDNALFTNAATYYVTLTDDVINIDSNFFSNASNTTATVTLDLNTHELKPIYSGTSPGAFVVADQATSTTTVYLASSTVAGKGLVVPGRIVVGRYGFGTLFVTNGNVSVVTTILANGAGGSGTIVLSGPNTVWNNSDPLAIGNNSNSFGSTLVISNSAVMDVVGTFRLGSGSSSGGSSNNTLLLDSGGRLFTHTGPATIGNNGSVTSWSPSYNNTATVQGGAVWDNGKSTMVIGYASGGGGATGNVLIVGAGGVVTNVSQLTISAGNTLSLQGGLFQGTTTCGGMVQGFGTVLGSVTISGGGHFSPANSLGQLTFSNSVTVAGGATTTVELGTNTSATVVRGNLTLGGTLNVIDGGGFTHGSYTLFTYSGTLTYNGLTIGTTPDSALTYTIDTSTPGAVKLNVAEPGVAGLTITNAVLQVGSVAVVVAGDTNVFNFDTSDLGDSPLSFQWSFGDGVTNDWSTSNTAEHVYGTNCGPYEAGLTVSNEDIFVSGNFTVVVACQLNVTQLHLQPNFAKTNGDACVVMGSFDLPAGYSFANKSATLDIGGAEVSFALNKRGIGVNGLSKFNKPAYNKKAALWKFKATLKKGSWQIPWADYSITNTNLPKPGVLITNVPVVLLLDTEAFMATTNLQYTAKQNKSGLAK